MSTTSPGQDELMQALRSLGGQAGGAQLQQRLGVSQPTLSRLLAPLVADGRVVAVGAARARDLSTRRAC